MEQYENSAFEKKVVLLDLSMFLLDLLTPQKIKDNFSSSNIILEVPSALVTMMWSALADADTKSYKGHRILFEFIYAHLLGVKNNPIHHKSQNQRILDVVYADQEKLHSLASTAYQKLFLEFAPLIEGATKKHDYSQEVRERQYSQFPIRRYEPAVFLSSEEKDSLQDAYKNNFGLQPHPLYDLYFLQIYHAQTIGFAASPILLRQLIALGRQTFYSLKEWKKTADIKWDEKKYSEKELVQVQEFLATFTEWEPVILGVLIDITISSIAPGGNFVITAIASGIASKKAEDGEKKSNGPIMRAIIVSLIVFLIVRWGCPPIFTLVKILGTSSIPSPTPTRYLVITPVPTQTIFSPPVLYTPTIEATIHPTISPISTTVFGSNPDYCLYVVQPGDTLLGIANRFMVSENDIRNSDIRVSRGIFALHQLVMVNAPCCTQIGINNGYSYSVQPKDNVFRLAINLSTSVDAIVSANNLGDSRYIQAGQMLCIPY